MLTAIKFDNNFCFSAIKIHYVIPDNLLSIYSYR